MQSSQSPEPAYLTIARGELGVREGRPDDNARIVRYHAATRLRAKSHLVAWCASFVCWCLERAGVQSTKSAAAASYAKWGVSCELKPGAIVVFGKADPDAAGTGHVAFCVDVEADWVLVLGGNQRNSVCVSRKPRSSIVAVRWPEAA